MKCHKCGSALDTGFNCPKCGYKRYEQADIQPELTTAKKLLWLWKAFNNIILEHRYGGYAIFIDGMTAPFIGKNKKEAINAAYEWVIAEMVKEDL